MLNINETYSESARFDSRGHGLTEDELYRKAPSIFADTAHHSRSERFRTIPTIDVLRGLVKEGVVAVGAKQCISRDKGKQPFTKHLVRLRKIGDDAGRLQVGDTVFEALLKNANDGSAAYELMGGLFRIRCLNSLVEQSGTIDAIKVRHSGHAVENVIEGTYRVLGNAEKALAAPQEWAQIQLEAPERIALATAAHTLRFENTDGEIKTPVRPRQLLDQRRVEDNAYDLWTVGNVIQENMIRGGLTAIGRDSLGRERRVTTRAIKGIDQDIRLNKALWVLMEQMAKLKTQA